MKFTKPSVAYLHAARGSFPTVPEPEKSQPRFKHMVAHRPLQFSTEQHDAELASSGRKPRNRKPKKSFEDIDFVPKVPKPFTTMSYSVNGYGTKNNGKGQSYKSNDHYHGPNRAMKSGNRVDARNKPIAFRPAPEPIPVLPICKILRDQLKK
jgi:hypothetical protein